MIEKRIGISDAIIVVKDLIALTKKKIVIISIVGVGFFLIGFFLLKPSDKFVATTSIMLKSSSAQGGLLNLASQFGLDNNQGITFEKFKGIATSNRIIKQTIQSTFIFENEEIVVGKFLIDTLHLWEDKPEFSQVDFAKVSNQRDTVINHLATVLKGMITIAENEEELVVLNVTSSYELYSKHVNDILLKSTIRFFKESAMNTDLRSKRIIQKKLDSINDVLFTTENAYAKLKDESFMTVKTQGYIELLRLERQMKILNEMLVETTKQNEIYAVKVLNSTPSIDIVDTPEFPITNTRRSRVVLSLILFMVGVFGTIGVLYFQTYYAKLVGIVNQKTAL